MQKNVLGLKSKCLLTGDALKKTLKDNLAKCFMNIADPIAKQFN